MKTGGYEQNRDDAYDDGRERPYQFSRHSKYYYAQGLNGFPQHRIPLLTF